MRIIFLYRYDIQIKKQQVATCCFFIIFKAQSPLSAGF